MRGDMSSRSIRNLIALTATVLTITPFFFKSLKDEILIIPEFPKESLAIAFINRPGSEAGLLAALRLDEILQIDDPRMAILSSSLITEISSIFRRYSTRIWIGILELEHRSETNSWKPHFCILIEPHEGQVAALTEAVDRAITRLVGPQASSLGSHPLRVFQGINTEKVMYRVLREKAVLVANSSKVLDRTLASLDGMQPGLRSNIHFTAIATKLLRPRGIFLYLDGTRILPLLPYLGYRIEQSWGTPDEEWVTIPP
jgi:hypothetical protein